MRPPEREGPPQREPPPERGRPLVSEVGPRPVEAPGSPAGAAAHRARDVLPGPPDGRPCDRLGAAARRLRDRPRGHRHRPDGRAGLDARPRRGVRARRGGHRRGPVRVLPGRQPHRAAAGRVAGSRTRLGGRPLGAGRGGRRGRAGTAGREPQPAGAATSNAGTPSSAGSSSRSARPRRATGSNASSPTPPGARERRSG